MSFSSLRSLSKTSEAESSVAVKWLKINIALLGTLLLLIGGFHFTQLLFNEIMMLLGAYNFTFILLNWVLFVDAFLNTSIQWLSKRLGFTTFKVSRLVSVVLAYAGLIFFIFIFVISALPYLSVQLLELQQFIPKAFARLEGVVELWQKELDFKFPAVLTQQIQEFKHNVVEGLFKLGSKSFTPLFYILLGQLISMYLLIDGDKITKFVSYLLPTSRNNRLSRGLVLSQVLMFRTMKAYTVIALVSGIIMFITFKIIALPYAGLLAVLYGLFCYIPVLGPWLGLVIPLLILLSHLALMKLLILCIASGIFHLIRSRFLSGRLFDRRYRLHPIVLLLVLQMSVDLVGLWGFLFVIPIAVLIATTKRLFFMSPIKKRRG
jgi:predicted PurR-regulated permease PerM